MLNLDLTVRIYGAIRDLREAEDKLLVLLEELESSAHSKHIDDDRDYIVVPELGNDAKFFSTSNPAQSSDNLSRRWSGRDDAVRYPDPTMGGSVRNGRTL